MAVLMGLTLLGGRAIEPGRPEFMLGPNGASRLGEGVTTLLAATLPTTYGASLFGVTLVR